VNRLALAAPNALRESAISASYARYSGFFCFPCENPG